MIGKFEYELGPWYSILLIQVFINPYFVLIAQKSINDSWHCFVLIVKVMKLE